VYHNNGDYEGMGCEGLLYHVPQNRVIYIYKGMLQHRCSRSSISSADRYAGTPTGHSMCPRTAWDGTGIAQIIPVSEHRIVQHGAGHLELRPHMAMRYNGGREKLQPNRTRARRHSNHEQGERQEPWNARSAAMVMGRDVRTTQPSWQAHSAEH